MTIASVVKVYDGLILAADSATTLTLSSGESQVWNHANKIVHLHRKYPVALMTWGLGAIGSASIATLAKDLRRRLMGQEPGFAAWELQDQGWTMLDVAERATAMFFDELFLASFPDPAAVPEGSLGLLIAGYSPEASHAEGWVIGIPSAGGGKPVPELQLPAEAFGWRTYAQPEATERLFLGIDQSLLRELSVTLAPAEHQKVLEAMNRHAHNPAHPAMPFTDAIRLAKYLAEVTAGYNNFLLGPNTVGGVIDVASINRHEGFRWVQRKHYYSAELNPWGHAW